eukprot:2367166-Pleurochrysis_carterae.AAC.1
MRDTIGRMPLVSRPPGAGGECKSPFSSPVSTFNDTLDAAAFRGFGCAIFGRARRLFVVGMRRRRLREKLVSAVLAVAFDLQVLLCFFDPALPLRLRLLRVVVRGRAFLRLGLNDVLIEAEHLPSGRWIRVVHEARFAPVERMRFARIVALVHVALCAPVAKGGAARTRNVAVARESVVMRAFDEVIKFVGIEVRARSSTSERDLRIVQNVAVVCKQGLTEIEWR